MRKRFCVGVGVAVVLAGVLFARPAKADTVFRIECFDRGTDTFLLDPQTVSLPDQLDRLQSYISLCLEVGGHPQVNSHVF
jgi:hypothetical protein